MKDADQDDHGLVWGTVPATVDRPTPVMALNAHLDTSPETSGRDVNPQVIRDYAGGDIVRREVIPAASNENLAGFKGG